MSSSPRVVVIGATGNVGLATVRALTRAGHEVVGVARRVPDDTGAGGVEWLARDVVTDPLEPVLEGADAVVHLAWLIQPSRDLAAQWVVNVDAFDRVLAAVRAVGVPALVVNSSVGAYSPRTDQRPVQESWPTHGVADSSYARQKAYMERMLDAFEAEADTRVVRFRPALIFQLASASEQRRLFGGALLPNALLAPGRLPVLPHLDGVSFQAVHADDVAEAIRLAVEGDAHGAFNLAAEDVLTTRDVAELLGARSVPVPVALARLGAAAAWRLRLTPVSPGWLELAARSPLLDATRAHDELGWTPTHRGRDALATVLAGIARGTGGPTPTLHPDRDGRDVAGELATRQGAVYDTSDATDLPQRSGNLER